MLRSIQDAILLAVHPVVLVFTLQYLETVTARSLSRPLNLPCAVLTSAIYPSGMVSGWVVMWFLPILPGRA